MAVFEAARGPVLRLFAVLRSVMPSSFANPPQSGRRQPHFNQTPHSFRAGCVLPIRPCFNLCHQRFGHPS